MLVRGKQLGRQQGPRWSRALGLSVAAHLLGLGALWFGAAGRSPRTADLNLPAWLADVGEAATPIDLAAIDDVSPAALPAPASAPVRDPVSPEPAAAPFSGDQTTAARDARASARTDKAQLLDDRLPAPDRGAEHGRAVDQTAWRRDGSTLRDRVADGAELDQAAHARTARVAGSPQAVRREPETGVGDSVRTQRAEAALPAAEVAVTDSTVDGLGGDTRLGVAHDSDRPERMPLPVAAHTLLASTQGPLDGEAGTRSFDVERPAFAPADDRASRAASTAQHPSITDLTLASVSGNTGEGHGPSDIPGAVARPSAGVTPALAGTRGTVAGVDQAVATRERIYDRYNKEIQARIDRALIWPRALALRLEQGETLVRFVVRPDGHLAAEAQVVKSAGFVEFDQAALAAVHKASPFPPMPQDGRHGSLVVTLRVPFSNPAVR